MFEVYKTEYAYFVYREGFGLLMLGWPSLQLKLMGFGDMYLPTNTVLEKHGTGLYAGKLLIGFIDEGKTAMLNQLVQNW